MSLEGVVHTAEVRVLKEKGQETNIKGEQAKPCFVYMLFKDGVYRCGMIELGVQSWCFH